MPLESTAEGSNQPSYKSIVVRLDKHAGGTSGIQHTSDSGTHTPAGHGDEKKREPQPEHLS